MNVIGKWKITKLGIADPEFGIKLATPEEIAINENIDDDSREEYLREAAKLMEFKDDGSLITLFPIPEGMEEAAKEDGAVIIDGCAIVGATEWKEADGKVLVNLNIAGEVLGEGLDPFQPVEVIDDDHILYNMGLVLLERL